MKLNRTIIIALTFAVGCASPVDFPFGDGSNGGGGGEGGSAVGAGGATGGGLACGDGVCTSPEDCGQCAADCGVCPAACGDAICQPEETCSTCSSDCGPCGPVCGDATCDATESCQSCQSDCGVCAPVCGDLVCDATETCQSCVGDCGACPSTCSHPICSVGNALASGCEPCVTQICAADSFCCTDSWDSQCVGEVTSICGQACMSLCAHDPCVTGIALNAGCDPCVAQICNVDSFCCSNSWDATCVDEVGFVCGQFCI